MTDRIELGGTTDKIQKKREGVQIQTLYDGVERRTA